MSKINSTHFFSFLLAFGFLMLVAGCSGGANDSPLTPDAGLDLKYSGGQTVTSHNLWSYSEIHIDPVSLKYEVIPVRIATGHWNVLKWLETNPCTDCLKVTGITPSGNGTLLVDVDMRHPFPNLNFTGFDVRAIVMFPGSLDLPEFGLIAQDPSAGDGYLVNAEGYTSLYNPTTLGGGPGGLQGYSKGKLATPTAPNATLNGFLRFVSNDPANTRNAFYSGVTISRTFEIKMPGAPFALGYAVDASWTTPTTTPVTDPMTDFPTSANCPEPWKIVVSGNPILNIGQTALTIDVYDRQGKATFHDPIVECPALFEGTSEAVWVSDGADFSRYEAVVRNRKYVSEGDYLCVIGVEANENDPVGKPWLDLTAYQTTFITVNITHGELIWAKRGGGALDESGYGIAKLSDNSFVVTGIFHGTATFGAGEANETTLTGTGIQDYGDIFVARYNADGTLDWAKQAGGDFDDYGIAVAVLSDDSIIVSGTFLTSATFGEGEPEETVLSGGLYDVFIARYDSNGSLAWARSAGGSQTDFGNKITVLAGDSFALTGFFNTTAVFGLGETAETTLISAAGNDIFVAKYLPNGDLVWAKRAGGAGADNGNAIGTLSDDSILIAGDFSLSATFGPGESNETILDASGSTDIFVARYNSSGALIWAKRAGGDFGDSVLDLTVLLDDSYIMSGYFAGTAIFGPGEANETTLSSASGGPDKDLLVARYNPNGTCVWAKRAGAIGNEIGHGVVKLLGNGVVVTGEFMGSAIFGPGESNETTLECVSGLSLPDIFVARYNLDGTLAWVNAAGGTGYENAYAIAVLTDNSTVATGEFEGSCTFGPGEPNETVLTSDGGRDMFVARYYP